MTLSGRRVLWMGKWTLSSLVMVTGAACRFVWLFPHFLMCVTCYVQYSVLSTSLVVALSTKQEQEVLRTTYEFYILHFTRSKETTK